MKKRENCRNQPVGRGGGFVLPHEIKQKTMEHTAATTPTPQLSDGNVAESEEKRTNGHGHSATERKLASRIQDAIDDRGRFSYKLKDLSMGFAAGRGISEQDARDEITQIFTKEIGQSPQEYLEASRIAQGLSVDQSRGR